MRLVLENEKIYKKTLFFKKQIEFGDIKRIEHFRGLRIILKDGTEYYDKDINVWMISEEMMLNIARRHNIEYCCLDLSEDDYELVSFDRAKERADAAEKLIREYLGGKVKNKFGADYELYLERRHEEGDCYILVKVMKDGKFVDNIPGLREDCLESDVREKYVFDFELYTFVCWDSFNGASFLIYEDATDSDIRDIIDNEIWPAMDDN